MTKLALALTVGMLGSVCAWGQDIISAHSGTIQYVEGKVTLDGNPVELKFAHFPEVKNDHVLATEEGRAEILMTPGVFLRLSEDSSFRMIDNQLADTRFEIVSGDALLEVDDLPKDNAVTVQFLGTSTALTRTGLYRFDTDKSQIKVYQGHLKTTLGDQTVSVRSGKEIHVGSEKLTEQFFDAKDTDPFYRWAERRSGYIATANVSSARQAGSMGLVSNPSSWAWNPYYGMFTFLPGYGFSGYDGFGYSPFGYYYYSPLTVGYALPVSGFYYGSPRPAVSTRGAGGLGSTSSGAVGAVPQRSTITGNSPGLSSVSRGGTSIGTSIGPSSSSAGGAAHAGAGLGSVGAVHGGGGGGHR